MPAQRQTHAVVLHPQSFDELPKKKREFIEQYIRTGDAKRAAIVAGYSEKSATMKASQLKRELNSYISDKIIEYARGNEMAILGVNALASLVETADSDSVKLSAAKELVKLTLPETPKEVNINHNVKHLSDEEIDKRLRSLAQQLDMKDVTPYVERIDGPDDKPEEA